jgi:hypothetical protein
MDEKDSLITEQQLKIRELEKVNDEYKKALKDINGLIYCCGGPLNDNYYKYNKEQLGIFVKIANLSYIDSGEENE